MFAQLLLTIKKKVDSGEMPPKYLGVFDREKIAFTELRLVLKKLAAKIEPKVYEYGFLKK